MIRTWEDGGIKVPVQTPDRALKGTTVLEELSTIGLLLLLSITRTSNIHQEDIFTVVARQSAVA